MKKLTAIVLAAGKGTRMNSDKPKILHEIGQEPMVFHTLKNLSQLDLDQTIVVVSHKSEEVKEAISQKFEVEFALQETPLGTGDALRTAIKQVRDSEIVLVVGGDDSAFYKTDTLQEFIKSHQETGATVSFISTFQDNSKAFGRVIRDEYGEFKTIIEDKDYRESGLFSEEVNCGAYLFDAEFVREHIDNLTLSSKGEYYINNFLDMAVNEGKKVNIYMLQDPEEWVGVNTPEELERANELYQKYQD